MYFSLIKIQLWPSPKDILKDIIQEGFLNFIWEGRTTSLFPMLSFPLISCVPVDGEVTLKAKFYKLSFSHSSATVRRNTVCKICMYIIKGKSHDWKENQWSGFTVKLFQPKRHAYRDIHCLQGLQSSSSLQEISIWLKKKKKTPTWDWFDSKCEEC